MVGSLFFFFSLFLIIIFIISALVHIAVGSWLINGVMMKMIAFMYFSLDASPKTERSSETASFANVNLV